MLVRLAVPPDVADTIIALVGRTARREADASPMGCASPATLNEVAGLFHTRSLARSEVVGPRLVTDAAWNMMLKLYANAEDPEVTVAGALCGASGSPPAAALRYLYALEAEGLIKRRSDPIDPMRALIDLSNAGYAKMGAAIAGFCVAPPKR